jgi:hypothetical protein
MTGEHESKYQIFFVMALTVNPPKIGLCSQPRDGWGTILEEWIMDNDLTSLNDGCGTKLNCATTGESALDVTLVHNSLVTGTNWKWLLARRSAHFPLLCEVDV